MSIIEATRNIKLIYSNSSMDTKENWDMVMKQFNLELMNCNDSKILLAALELDYDDWLLPFEERINLMEKIKSLGVDDLSFLKDYYGYKAAFLDPTDEQKHAKFMLEKLMNESN